MKRSHGRLAKIRTLLLTITLALLFAGAGSQVALGQSDPDEEQAGPSMEASATVTRNLASHDPLERQRAAEELARTGATEQLRLVEGYRLQEKDARVRLALDWALYRMGKPAALFSIVRNLDSSRRHQATTYLKRLEGPEPLYIFLERVKDETLIYLLEALAGLGNTGTIARLGPYVSSSDPRVSNAAKFALREIERREAQPQTLPTRERRTGKTAETTEPEDTAPEEAP
jgi:HEAT repeat protein